MTGIARAFGVVGYAMILLTFGLPFAAGLAAMRGSRLALIPLLGSMALFAAWIVYYATDWWQLEANAMVPAFAAVLLGWTLLALAFWQLRRERAVQATPST